MNSAGLGYIPPPEPANPYAKSSTSTKTKLGSKAEDAATEALRKRLTGKKGQARVVPLNKSRPVGTHTPSTPKPRPAVPVLEEDEEEEGRSGLGNAKRKREVEVEVKGKRMDGDGESGEDSADDLRGKKSALSYMDELLQEKRRKKKKKKKKSKVDVAM